MRRPSTDSATAVLTNHEELGNIEGVRIFRDGRTTSSEGKAHHSSVALDEKRKPALWF